jgi:hypothetical protein
MKEPLPFWNLLVHCRDKSVVTHTRMHGCTELIDGKVDGFFLVRRFNTPEQFVISVVYRGKPTNHLVHAPTEGPSTVNKKPTGVTGIANTISLLRNMQPFWPVPLDGFVRPAENADQSRESTAPTEDPPEDTRAADEATARREREAEDKRRDREAEDTRRGREAEDTRRDEARRAEELRLAEKRRADDETQRQTEVDDRKRETEDRARRDEERRREEERAKESAEEAQRKREQEEADENAITGFFELDDPFPEGDEEDYGTDYITVSPDATTLVQAARDLARRSQSRISPEAPLRHSVGKILKLDVAGESSTEDGVRVD